MVITYFGRSYFKLSLGDLTIALNPPAKSSNSFGGKAPRFGADIALISTHTLDHDGAETVTLGDKEPFVIDGPGSYEVKDILITGAATTTTIAGKAYITTVYGFELDNIKIAFLGAVADEKTFSSEVKEIISKADMVFVPVGDEPARAYKMAVSFDPNVIIPMEYDEMSLQRFLKEGGQEKNEIADKATLKRRDLDGKEGYILPLSPQA